MRILSRAKAVVLTAVFALVATAGVSVPVNAAGGTATWTDATGDHKFSTAGNWVENAIPENGDVLVFDTLPSSLPSPYNVINDVDVTFSGVKSQGNALPSYTSIVLQNDLKLSADSSWNISDSKQLLVYTQAGKRILVAGNFTVMAGYPSNGPKLSSGTLTLQNGVSAYSDALTSGASRVVVENGANINCFTGPLDGSNQTISTPITLGGGSGTSPAKIFYSACAGGGVGTDPVSVLTLNDVTLLADARIGVWGNDSVKVVKLTDNGHKLTREQGADGTLVLPSGVQETSYPVKTTKLDGDKATTDVVVYPNETAILNGKRCNVSVREGGTLKGVGTLCSLYSYGTVAPGNSPGTITITGELGMSSTATYAVEVASRTNYDKLVAGSVMFDNPMLKVEFLSGAKVAAGDQYTIVSNTGTSPTSGTFKGLPEGAVINVNGGTLKISYEGGDGNDIVLTVMTVPTVPNTGFELMQSNPGVVVIATLASVAALVVIARRKLV